MAQSGGQPGNQNAAKGKRWLNAINSALEKRNKAEGQQALVDIAEKLIEAAAQGDQWAIKELGDRIDGKPAMTVAGDPENPLEVKTDLKDAIRLLLQSKSE